MGLDLFLFLVVYGIGPYYLAFVVIFTLFDFIGSRVNKRPINKVTKYLWLFVLVLIILLIFEKLLVYFVPTAKFKLM